MTGPDGGYTALQQEEMSGVRHSHRQGAGRRSLLRTWYHSTRVPVVMSTSSNKLTQLLHGIALDTQVSPCQRERKQNVRR